MKRFWFFFLEATDASALLEVIGCGSFNWPYSQRFGDLQLKRYFLD